MKNILCGQKKTKLLSKLHFVEKKTDMQCVLSKIQ